MQSSFDRAVADGFVDASRKLEGLPGYLGVVFVDFQPGRLRAEMEVRPELLTPFGNMHGGVLAALCDHVLGCVCYPHMTRGQWAATTEFKLNYLAPVSKGQVVVEAEIIAMTRATAVVRIEARNGDRLACIAQGTVLIRDPKE
ncbi:MAG: PaaI family thioesterase [Deltaproteobacteria bacterium]|nr:PaaI family thioesterase [Deltaproteobacteria bacterium]